MRKVVAALLLLLLAAVPARRPASQAASCRSTSAPISWSSRWPIPIKSRRFHLTRMTVTCRLWPNRRAGFRRSTGAPRARLRSAPIFVLVGPNDRRETRRVLTGLNIPVADVALVTDIAAARLQILAIAERLGHPERGEATMARALDAARARLAAVARPLAKTALVVERGGYVEDPQSLVATLLAEAGFRLPAGAPSGYGGYMSLETLLVTRSDVLVLKDPPLQAEDQGALFFTHPAVVALYPPERRVSLPTRYTLCGGPALIEAMDYLADVLRPSYAPSELRPLSGSDRWRSH